VIGKVFFNFTVLIFFLPLSVAKIGAHRSCDNTLFFVSFVRVGLLLTANAAAV